MARIKDASVDAVKAAANIVDLVEARTRLRKVGGRYTGLCPFHEEKTPSFSVSPDRGTYHCFGCGAGGDAISFVRETEGVDFVGAIEWLADRFHVELEYEEASPQADAERRRRERLHALLEQAASFYERLLWESETGRPVRAYLDSRGLGVDVCREFRLGLSPRGGTLVRKAREKGFTGDELTVAGLVTRRGTDYFQRRLMFPVADTRGRVIGFQARKLHEDDPLRGKYVNSPESELFHKSHVLYGLHLARAAIAKQDRVLVVEGNTDVIALRQAGVHAVVASMGTALTERQLRELSRLTRRAYLCFDSDSAGQEATLRGMELAVKHGMDVRVVVLPEGRDPADDPTGFEERLRSAAPYALHRVRLEAVRTDDKQLAYLRIKDVLDQLPESPEKLDAWREANDKLGITVRLQGTRQSGLGREELSAKVVDADQRLERDVLAGLRAHRAELAKWVEIVGADDFDSSIHRRLFEYLQSPDEARADDELVPMLAELDARAEAEGIDASTAKQLLLRLRERRLSRELQAADETQLPDLQHKLAEIRTRIREFA